MLRDRGLIPLSHDHHHVLALCVFTERALAGGVPATDVRDRMAGRFAAETRDHFEFEEQVLFPELGQFPEMNGLVNELILEHRALDASMQALRTATKAAALHEFCAAIRAHIRKEEQSLFEQAQRLLSREQLDDIGRKRRGRD